MNKEEQYEINKVCYRYFGEAKEELRKLYSGERHYKKLRSCKAEVIETEHYYLLRSYNTFVACIHKNLDVLVDVLRTEYGYTATSAQHIAKFNHDYCRGYWGCVERYTARPV